MSKETRLSIAIKSDLRDGQSLLKFMNDLAVVGNKTAKALQSINIGSSGPGAARGGLAKALLEQKNLFNDLGKAGEQLSRILTNSLSRSTDELDRKLEKVNKQLRITTELHQTFERKLSEAKASGGDIAGAQASVESMESEARRLLATKNSILKDRAGLSSGGGSIWQKDLTGGALGSLFNALGLGTLARYAGVAGIPTLAAGGALNAIRNQERQQNAVVDLSAQTGGTMGPIAQRLAQGDMATAYGAYQMLGTKEGLDDLDKRLSHVRDRHRIDRVLSGLREGTLGMNPNGAAFDIRMALTELGTGNVEVKKAIEDQLQKTMQGESMGTWLAQRTEALAPGHVAAARRLGSRASVNWAINGASGYGIDDQTLVGIAGTIADTAGRFASERLRDVAAKAYRSGFTNAPAIAAATATDERILPLLAGTGFDRATQDILGQAVAAGMTPFSLVASGADRASMLAYGVGAGKGPFEQRLARQNIAGDQSLSAIFAGHDPYQKSVNLMSAIDNLGPNSSIYSQNLLATAFSDTNTLASVMNGHLPGYFKSAGIGLTAAQGSATQTLNQMLSRVVMDENTANTPMGRAAAAAMDSGDVAKWIRRASNEKRRDLATAFYSSNPAAYPNGPTQAEGAVRDIGGLGGGVGKPGTYKDPGEGSTDLALMRKQYEMAAKTFNQMTDAMSGMNGQSPQVLKTLTTMYQIFESLTKLHIKAEDAIPHNERATPGTGADIERAKDVDHALEEMLRFK